MTHSESPEPIALTPNATQGPPVPLQVTCPFFPPFDEFVERLRAIWDSGQLTNHGPLVKAFEQRVADLLGCSPTLAVANGDAGLRIAIRALGLSGSFVTTPFSYVSTVSSGLWLGLEPIFADIDPVHWTIDPAAVEAAIRPDTTAIVATHVFGNPCDVDALQEIADRRGLKLIFDAAHAFGVTFEGRSLLDCGDVSMVSLHATKLVHSGEGGILVARQPEIRAAMEWRRRFGHDGPLAYHGVGINSKMSELHAAMGLCVLDHWGEILAKRKVLWDYYARQISERAPDLELLSIRPNTDYNHSYFPVRFADEKRLLAAVTRLNAHHIFPRRYFHPSLNRIPQLGEYPVMSISESLADTILCLPLAHSMETVDCERVVDSLVASFDVTPAA